MTSLKHDSLNTLSERLTDVLRWQKWDGHSHTRAVYMHAGI